MKHPLFKSANAREEIARLEQRVARNAADRARTILDDVQMENPAREELGCIFLTASVTDDGRDLIFIAERVIYNPGTYSNSALGTESFRARSFSSWFAEKAREGWRLCS